MPYGPQVDPRDLLDTGADVVVTRDFRAAEYARARGGWRVTELPWDRTYVLLLHVAAPIDTVGLRDREALSRDLIGGAGRPAAAPFDWRAEPACLSMRSLQSAQPAGYVVHEPGDATARALAERIVALAPGLRAATLAPDALRAQLGTMMSHAAITWYPRWPAASCAGRPRVSETTPWVPLVDTRLFVMVRPGVPPFAFDADGGIRFLPEIR